MACLQLVPPRVCHEHRPQEARLDPRPRGSDCWKIGRAPSADVRLCSETAGRQAMIGRTHAMIRHGPTGWSVADQGSLNGLLLNGRRLAAGEHPIAPGDTLGFGQAHKLSEGAAHPNLDKVEFLYRFELAPEEGGGKRRCVRQQAPGLAGELADEELLCAICRGLVAGARVLECGHLYCYSCISSWLASKPDSGCPVCRAPVTSAPTVVQTLDKVAERVAANLFSPSELEDWHAMVQLSRDAASAARDVQQPGAADKRQLQAELAAAAGVARAALGRPGPESTNARSRLVVDYAPTGRGSCCECNREIGACAVRIGERFRHQELGFLMTRWHHLGCFRVPDGVRLADLEGTTGLQREDRERLKKMWSGEPENAYGKDPPDERTVVRP